MVHAVRGDNPNYWINSGNITICELSTLVVELEIFINTRRYLDSLFGW